MTYERTARMVGRRARAPRRVTARVHGVLRDDGGGARAARRGRRADRAGDAEDREADSGLARVPGLRRQHRVVPAREPSDRRRGRSSTCCRSTITRRSWPRPGTSAENRDRDGEGARRRLHRRRRRVDSDRRERRLLHDRRRVGARHRARGLRQRRGDDRDRHLRGVRRHSGGRARIRPARSASPTPCPASRT